MFITIKMILRLLSPNFVKTLVFMLVFGFTFILRAHNYDRTPGPGHLEEQMYAWQGLSLIETGYPVAWSTLPYPDRAEIFRGKVDYQGNKPEAFVRLYRPWLDEPPLYGLISGGVAHLYGANRNDIVLNTYIRLPAIIIGSLTTILVFLIAQYASGFWIGILSMLIYSTVPIFVLSTRLSVPENLITLLYCLVVWLLLHYQKENKVKYILFIPILVGAAGLAKATGFFIIALAIFICLKQKKYFHSLYLLVATLPFIALFLLYGFSFDSEIFRTILHVQSSRPVGFAALGWFFVSPAFDINTMTDTWYIFCLLSTAFFLFKFKSQSGSKFLILLSAIYWLIVVMISGGEQDVLPWYRYPAFPFLAISAAWSLQYIIKKSHLFGNLFVIGLLLGSRSLLINDFRSNLYPLEVRIYSLLLAGPTLLNNIFRKKIWGTISRGVTIGIIIIGIYFNIVYIYNQFELACENKTCTIMESSRLSTIHFPVIWRFFVLGPPFHHD